MLVPIHLDVAASSGDQFVSFRCSRCGLPVQASVSGTGTSLRMSGVSLSDAGADARIGAVQAAQLAPCPRCGHRSWAALVKVLLVGVSVGALAGFAAALAAAEQLHASDPSGRVGLLVGLATFLAVVAMTTTLKLRSAQRRVRFHHVGG